MAVIVALRTRCICGHVCRLKFDIKFPQDQKSDVQQSHRRNMPSSIQEIGNLVSVPQPEALHPRETLFLRPYALVLASCVEDFSMS